MAKRPSTKPVNTLDIVHENETEFSLAVYVTEQVAEQVSQALEGKNLEKATIHEYKIDPDVILNADWIAEDFKSLRFVQAAKKGRIRIYENGEGTKCVLALKGPQQAGQKDQLYKMSERTEDSLVLTNESVRSITGGRFKKLKDFLAHLANTSAITGFNQRDRYNVNPEIASIVGVQRKFIGLHVDIFKATEPEGMNIVKIDFETANREELDAVWELKNGITNHVREQLGIPSLRASKSDLAARNWKGMQASDPRKNPANLMN